MKSQNILRVEGLSAAFSILSKLNKKEEVRIVHDVSFELNRGEILALVGESGSGKSVSALSILKLLPYPQASHPSGRIFFEEKELLQLSEREIQKIRGAKISMIFQEPMTSLNPLHSIKRQISEAITLHNPIGKKALETRIGKLISLVGLGELKSRLHAFPHELSGGQRQRVMIAVALANEPDILIADEPTTALDVTIQAEILDLLKSLQKQIGLAILFITHDLTIVRNIADRVAVMQAGKIIETGSVKEIFANPRDSYTKHLLSSEPDGNPTQLPENAIEILTAANLKVHFPVKKGFFGNSKEHIKAVDGVNINLKHGHTLGVVGESGSGKSTLALALVRLLKSQGIIRFKRKEIHNCSGEEMRCLRQKIQMVFQDPFSSLNPRMSVSEILSEGLLAHNIGINKAEYEEVVNKALGDVKLPLDIKTRYPHEFSGGERQRIGIARALILKPSFIALDEPTSALDLSTQAELLNMLKSLQKKYGLSYLFISHDLRVIKSISHDIIVMKGGKIIEEGTNQAIFENPQDDYTKALIDAAFSRTRKK